MILPLHLDLMYLVPTQIAIQDVIHTNKASTHSMFLLVQLATIPVNGSTRSATHMIAVLH